MGIENPNSTYGCWTASLLTLSEKTQGPDEEHICDDVHEYSMLVIYLAQILCVQISVGTETESIGETNIAHDFQSHDSSRLNDGRRTGWRRM